MSEQFNVRKTEKLVIKQFRLSCADAEHLIQIMIGSSQNGF